MTPTASAALVATAPQHGSDDTGVITFADGLLGFPECRSFLLCSSSSEGVYWLQSTQFEPLAFLLVDPFRFFDGYSVELSDVDVARLQPAQPSDIAILTTVTLNASGATANLQGPLALNLATGKARQVIAAETGHGVRAPLELPPIF
jgi:flagellar assembly factor FliW